MDSPAYLRDVVRTFRNYKALAERAMAQVPSDADLHTQMQKAQDAETDALRKDALDELKARLGDTGSARDMATELAKAHSGLAYGGVVVSVACMSASRW